MSFCFNWIILGALRGRASESLVRVLRGLAGDLFDRKKFL